MASTPTEFSEKARVSYGFMYWMLCIAISIVFVGTTWYWNSDLTQKDLNKLRSDFDLKIESMEGAKETLEDEYDKDIASIRKEHEDDIKELKTAFEEDIDVLRDEHDADKEYVDGRIDRKAKSVSDDLAKHITGKDHSNN